MSETDTDEETSPKKKSKIPLLAGLVLAVAGGAGGFFATSTGLILGSGDSPAPQAEAAIAPIPDVAFVEIQPITISIGSPADRQHLRFRGHLEVNAAHRSDVEALLPRVVDVMNEYLQTLELSDIEERTALVRLRSHLLRRAQVVVGEGRVLDLLIMEFVVT